MAPETAASSRLRHYLDTLPDGVRDRLARAIVESAESARGDPALKALQDMLAPLGGDIRDPGILGPLADARRRFTQLLEPFAVHASGSEKFRRRIDAGTVGQLWDWLAAKGGEAMTAAMEEADAAVTPAGAAEADDRLHAAQAELLRDLVAQARGSNAHAFQLETELGISQAVDHLDDAARILSMAAPLRDLMRQLPAQIAQLDKHAVDFLIEKLLAFPAEALDIPLIAVASRLAVPAQVARLAPAAEQTDNAVRLAKGRWAAAVEVAIVELEISAAEIAGSRRPREAEAVAALLRRAYQAAKAIAQAVELDSGPAWHARITAVRKRISDQLSRDLGELPAMLRHAVRPIIAADVPQRSDARSIEDTERLLSILVAAKPYRGELALNDLVDRYIKQIESYLENANQLFLTVLRSGDEGLRNRAVAGFPVMCSFSRRVFGEDYANLFRRSAAVASGGAINDDREFDAPAAVA